MSKKTIIAVIVIVTIASAAVTALLINIFEKKTEAAKPYVRVVEVDEQDTNPEKWKANWPKQFDLYKKTAIATRTRFEKSPGPV